MADEKKKLNASEGIENLFGMDKTPEQAEPIVEPKEVAEKTEAPPANLPVAEPNQLPAELTPAEQDVEELSVEQLRAMPDLSQPAAGRSVTRVVLSILPYLAIFLIGLGLFFYYFSDFSFQNLLGDSLRLESLTAEDRDKNLEQLKEDVGDDYQVWIGQFFVDVNDASIISMDADVSGNGLSNLEKYMLNLNPKVYSTQGNVGDGQMVIDGINPWTGQPFTEKQQALVERYIYKELISNRITAAAITRGVTKFAQYVTDDSPYYIDPNTLEEMTNSGSTVVTPPQIPPSSGGNSSGGGGSVPTTPTAPEIRPDQAIDTSKPGLLEIPANRISVPIIWTKEVKDFDADLKKGIVHYPGTAMPGEVGLSYISGHSSGYLWDRSPYKQIFATLGQVADGTSFTITATQNNGQQVRYNYVVTGRGEYRADDQAQFVSTADSQVALSTCWPVGTVDRRLVIYAKLTQTER